MARRLFGLVAAAGLWLGATGDARAQLSISVGNPYTGSGLYIGNGLGYGYPGYGGYGLGSYGYSSYGYPGLGYGYGAPVTSFYSSGYYGAPVTRYYSSGYYGGYSAPRYYGGYGYGRGYGVPFRRGWGRRW